MFAEPGNFYCDGLQAIVPVIANIARNKIQSTVFTRFVPPQINESPASQWQAHYHQWLTKDFGQLSPEQYDLVEPLGQLSHPKQYHRQKTPTQSLKAKPSRQY